jgi:copper chaperone NosL
MRIRPRFNQFAVLAIAVVVLAGCGGEKEVSLDPPTVKYNEDISEMGMFVVDPRYTAAWLPTEGNDWILFDDIGEMFKYRFARFPDSEPRVVWVNDYNDQQWIKAEEAWYLESTDINSPMGWGLAAFRDEASARERQSEFGGTVLSWSDVQARPWSAPPAPEPLDDATPVGDATPQSGHTGH